MPMLIPIEEYGASEDGSPFSPHFTSDSEYKGINRAKSVVDKILVKVALSIAFPAKVAEKSEELETSLVTLIPIYSTSVNKLKWSLIGIS